MFDLIKVALRQRPRVIIVGEVRGREAYTLFQAMTTGHLSYSTVHANDMHTLIQRLENKPIDLPRALLTSLDLVVFLNSKTIEGIPVRRITNVTEIIKLDPGTNRLVTLTPFNWISEIDDRFENNGGSRILRQVKMQFGWNEKQLKKEIENRKMILNWMMKNNLRSYEDVGKIVAQYVKDPQAINKLVEEDSK
jgi:flagellar protein FlaI